MPTPFKVVTGTEILPKQPFNSLYQHVIQRDPKLHETLDRLAEPPNLTSNLANPLQVLTFGLGNPATNDTTPWVTVLSNDPTDITQYFLLALTGSVRVTSSTDIKLDIQVSHNFGVNFISLLNSNFVISAGNHVPVNEIITFADGAYLRNLDLVYMKFISAAFNGADINVSLMFQ